MEAKLRYMRGVYVERSSSHGTWNTLQQIETVVKSDCIMRLFAIRTVRCLTNVEAFVLRASDLKEVTSQFSRFLRSPRVQGMSLPTGEPSLQHVFKSHGGVSEEAAEAS
ncbi:hypothetical protein GUJ93_ZPchr0006g42141 [Zizania palustris]|uniref:Uncharacterized protein n=1 Tax=Zizania palustris TaxID=103762 RepID=A0A8J5T1L1_ZIZPA|nr:hypothetical protein GUJ93_ZPchr0006g42141 [Zizania palustris]